MNAEEPGEFAPGYRISARGHGRSSLPGWESAPGRYRGDGVDVTPMNDPSPAVVSKSLPSDSVGASVPRASRRGRAVSDASSSGSPSPFPRVTVMVSRHRPPRHGLDSFIVSGTVRASTTLVRCDVWYFRIKLARNFGTRDVFPARSERRDGDRRRMRGQVADGLRRENHPGKLILTLRRRGNGRDGWRTSRRKVRRYPDASRTEEGSGGPTGTASVRR